MQRPLAWLIVVFVVASLSAVTDSAWAKPPKGENSARSETPKKSKSAKNKQKSKSSTKQSTTTIKHEVKKGETLGAIAKKYGVGVKDLVRWNKLANADKLKIGQKLKVRTVTESTSSTSTSVSRDRQVIYVVRKGDTLSKIAKANKVSAEQLQKWNRALRKNPDKLKVGQKITIWVEGPELKSASVGSANKGKLKGGEQLPDGKGYKVRNRSHSWGTNLTVSTIMTVMAKYAAKYPKGARFVIGDLSFENGGKMKPHLSHQSGRDVDISFAAKGNEQLDGFVKMSKKNFDAEKNWYVIKSFVDTGDVQYIFVNYELQELLYEYATEQGVSESYLEKVLQYPNGKRSHEAIVRHSKGHDDHMHVRFVCPKGDKSCK
ncbi:MAG: penicillin-insensitive murein endopeptidase [Myxococcota bacterium]|nr:penicillin-insensitive murein endopeptidase [Myxococcota bacterium]